MHHGKSVHRMSVTFGGTAAVIRRDGSSSVVLAEVLGKEETEGVERIYLDRLVHDRFEDWKEFSASGAVSTILTRTVPKLTNT